MSFAATAPLTKYLGLGKRKWVGAFKTFQKLNLFCQTATLSQNGTRWLYITGEPTDTLAGSRIGVEVVIRGGFETEV